MKDCPVCGKAVRMGANRVRVNRKHGVYHYIAHRDGSTFCLSPFDWSTVMLKPYPKNEADKPRVHMMQRWEALERPVVGCEDAASMEPAQTLPSAAHK